MEKNQILILIAVVVLGIGLWYFYKNRVSTSSPTVVDNFQIPSPSGFQELDQPNTYNDMMVPDTNSFGDPRADGCCLFPNQPVCKRYTEDQISMGCCGKGYNGMRPTTSNFHVNQFTLFDNVQEKNDTYGRPVFKSGCTSCKRGAIL